MHTAGVVGHKSSEGYNGNHLSNFAAKTPIPGIRFVALAYEIHTQPGIGINAVGGCHVQSGHSTHTGGC